LINKNEATELGIRFLAIFNLVLHLSNLPELLLYADAVTRLDVDWRFGIWSLSIYLFNLLISALLWFGARTIAEWMWRGQQSRVSLEESITRRDLQVVIFSSIGLYLLASALPGALDLFVTIIRRIALNNSTGKLFAIYMWPDVGQAVDYLLKLAIAAWLLLASDRIVSVLERGRQRTSSSKTA